MTKKPRPARPRKKVPAKRERKKAASKFKQVLGFRIPQCAENNEYDAIILDITLASICQTIAPRAAGRKIRVVCGVGFPPTVQSDSVMIRAALTNLVENAVEYSPPNNEIQIDLTTQNGDFSLSVSNRAPNLTAQDISHLFDRFWRKDEARSGGDHAGLGLSLARAFCTSLSYRLEAQLKEDTQLIMTISGPVCPKNSIQNNINQNRK